MILSTPVGELRVFCEDKSVSQILLPGCKENIEPLKKKPRNNFEEKVKDAFDSYFSSDLKQVGKHWQNLVRQCNVIANFEGSTFRDKVYISLLNDVPTGSTISYGGLAALAGSPLASRAVGSAMRMNPLPIVVPCHRVITTAGKIGGYMGDGSNNVDMKKWLLSHEGLTTEMFSVK